MGHVKVELKNLPLSAPQEVKDKAFKGMLAAFKRRVNDYGVLAEFNQRQYYESRGQKVRRRHKEAALQRKKEENMKLNGGKIKKDKDKENNRDNKDRDRDYFFQV